jgi:hypothetical protein
LSGLLVVLRLGTEPSRRRLRPAFSGCHN